MGKIKLGVIGAGGIVRRLHLPDIAGGDDFEVTVISGRKEHRLKNIQRMREYENNRYKTDINFKLRDFGKSKMNFGILLKLIFFIIKRSINI